MNIQPEYIIYVMGAIAGLIGLAYLGFRRKLGSKK